MSSAQAQLMANMRSAFLLIALSCVIARSNVAFADFSGRVVAIQDGDTLTVLDEKTQIKVRLANIDAPERKQPFGTRSLESLRALCGGRSADVIEFGKDRYGRTVAEVLCAGIDVNAEQVRRGMAWVYVKYAARNSPLYALESEARLSRLGLWADLNPTPPWEWRRLKKR